MAYRSHSTSRSTASSAERSVGTKLLRSSVFCMISILVVSLVAPAAAAEPGRGGGDILARVQPYSDASQFGVHSENIEALAAEGVFEGTDCSAGLFCPRQPLPRWVMAVWLVRVLEILGDGGSKTSSQSDAVGFNDVDDSEWWAPHVNRLADLGITRGCATGRYCPDGPVTRGQMASFFVRALGLQLVGGLWFADIQDSVHFDSINALAASGITSGCATDRFCPSQSVTRAQMASFLNRHLEDVRSADVRTTELLGSAEPCPLPAGTPTAPAIVVVLRLQGCYHVVYELIGDRTPEQALEQVRQEYQDREGFISADLPEETEPLQPSNDPRVDQQWFLLDNEGTSDDDLNVEELWRGWDGDVTVAVLDTGVDARHEDLRHALVNPGPTYYDWDDPEYNDRDTGKPRNGLGHGTFVSGIIAAATNNRLAGASIAPEAGIMPFRHLGVKSLVDSATIMSYLQESGPVDINLRVVNMSYGPRDHNTGSPCRNEDMIKSLRAERGIVFVAAAGNDDQLTTLHSPASCGHLVIAVAATDKDGRRVSNIPAGSGGTWGSNWGGYVDLAAGGLGICSTTRVSGSSATAFRCGGGTSFAAPIVSGIVAHLVSRFPDATAPQIETALFHTARYRHGQGIGAGQDECGRFNREFGYGFVQPLEAIDMLRKLVGSRSNLEESCQEGAKVRIQVDDPPPPNPEVEISVGDPGGCTTSACAWIDIDLVNFPAGRHATRCGHDGVQSQGWGPGSWTPVGATIPSGGSERFCYFGFPGSDVWVEVDGIRSEPIRWPACVGDTCGRDGVAPEGIVEPQLSGPQQYWWPGAAGKGYGADNFHWTYAVSDDVSVSNWATWNMGNVESSSYRLQAFIPHVQATAEVKYHIYQNGTLLRTVSLQQRYAYGWTTLVSGMTLDGRITVRVNDHDAIQDVRTDGQALSRIGIDAMRLDRNLDPDTVFEPQRHGPAESWWPGETSKGYGADNFHWTFATGDNTSATNYATWDMGNVESSSYRIDAYIPHAQATAEVKYHIYQNGTLLRTVSLLQKDAYGWITLVPDIRLDGRITVRVNDHDAIQDVRTDGQPLSRIGIDAMRLGPVHST